MKGENRVDHCARWEHFEHEADVGVRGCGVTLDEALEQAALGLTAVVTDPASVRPVEKINVRCEAADRELLLVEWLNRIIFEGATRNMLFGRFRVRVDDNSLCGILSGETLDRARHQPAVEPKGATYTALQVSREPDGCWCAQCVVDV